MTNKAYDFFFKINRNNEVTEIQIVDSLNIPLKQYYKCYKWHKIDLALSIILTPEPLLDSEDFSVILSVTNLFSVNWKHKKLWGLN